MVESWRAPLERGLSSGKPDLLRPAHYLQPVLLQARVQQYETCRTCRLICPVCASSARNTHSTNLARLSLVSFSLSSSPTTQDLKTRSKTWTSTRSGKRIPTVRPGVVVMKFGEQLRSSVIHEYQWYYIDYDGLKDELKHPTGPIKLGSKGPEWTEDDETRFVGKLEAELEKVHTKQQVKAMEISRRIAVSEREVKEVVNRLNERGLDENGPSEEEFMLLEEDLSDIIADVHDLAKFVQLNYTGFYKIIKKHDVSCPC
ncbi:hypothetical protein CEP51_009956 [Fusarium floridanum]|uniref:SPX domain-containing protein n=1 Tax=Fusarium floridanum TaxID=1325733 RepID=A0A428RFZ0_9HYPO|nr:hypothetical protein CEP51_009956 [Fusarium floridanum]